MKRLWGKLLQLSNLPLRLWSRFVQGWWRRKQSGTVPCAFPRSKRLLKIPLRDFYASYGFFCESRRGSDELAFFINRLVPGDVIYDVGAFRGVYGVAAKAALGDSVSVHLFEPIKQNFEAIEEVAQLNQLQRFEIIPKALGLGATVRGTLDPKDGMLREGKIANAPAPVEMPATSVDLYVNETGLTPSIIKLDVEGFELQVLEGAHSCLSRHKPRLWIELHPTVLAAQGRHWKEIVQILKSIGYGTMNFYSDYELPTRDQTFHLWCED